MRSIGNIDVAASVNGNPCGIVQATRDNGLRPSEVRGLRLHADPGSARHQSQDPTHSGMTYSLLCVGMRRGPSSTTKLPPAFARQVLGDPFGLRLKEEQRAPVSSFFSHLRGTPRAKLR